MTYLVRHYFLFTKTKVFKILCKDTTSIPPLSIPLTIFNIIFYPTIQKALTHLCVGAYSDRHQKGYTLYNLLTLTIYGLGALYT